MAENVASVEPLLARRARRRQGQVRARHQGRALGVRHRRDGAGLQDRHRPGCAGRAPAARAACPSARRKRCASSRTSTRCCARPAPTAANLVRTDQYYTTVKAVPPYQQVRREFLCGRIPPSTSIAQQGLLLPGADMNIQAMGVIPQPGFEVTHLKHEALAGRPDVGLFAGADGRRFHLHSRHHLARGRRRAAAQWRRRGRADDRRHAMGRPADQARNRVHHHKRMVQSLALAGARLEDVVHAQVYLTDPEDYSAFNEVVVAALRRDEADARR